MAEQCPKEQILDHEFFEKSRLRNFALLVEGQKLWVSREALAEHSPVFETMFFWESREAQEGVEQMELPDKKLRDFIEFLRVTVSPELKPVTSKYRVIQSCIYVQDGFLNSEANFAPNEFIYFEILGKLWHIRVPLLF